MKTPSLALLFAAALIPISSHAVMMTGSKALEELQTEADRAIVGSSAEWIRSSSAEGFTGERAFPKAAPVNAEAAPRDIAAGKDLKTAPTPNLAVDTPLAGKAAPAVKKTPSRLKSMSEGDSEPTEMEKLVKLTTRASLIVGAGLTIAGIFVPPLLFFGGFLLGVGVTLYVITKLFGGQ